MYYLGIDLGTSSVKVLAINSDHEIVGDISREYPVYYPQEKWAEQDPNDWWEQTATAIRDLMEKYQIPSDSVAAIGFSGQMHGLVALDEHNEVLFPAILWCDQRTEEECEDITRAFGSDLLREYTGNKALTGFTAPKVLWIKKNQPELFAKIKHILLPKDYLRYKLTGDYATDVSDASGTLMFDVRNRQWSKPVCDYLGVDESQLPIVYESYEVTGKVSEEVKALLGLTGEVLVVGGAGDQAAGAVGTGTVEEGIVSVTLGTSGVVFAAHQNFVVDPECRLHAFCHANGKYHTMGVMLSAASCLKWWVDEAQAGADFDTLLEEADAAGTSDGVIFLPYLLGERTPYPDPDAKGCFLGMDMNTRRGNLTRAVLEGVAFGLRDSLEIVKDLNIPIQHIRVIGGGARSYLWKQILADTFKTEIEEINTNQGGGLGAAILAAVGAGLYQSVDEGCQKMITVVKSIKPIESNMKFYDQLYPKYQSAYQSLKEWF
ncbi:MAG: xylulokinase [Anaerolineaceae bacterium]